MISASIKARTDISIYLTAPPISIYLTAPPIYLNIYLFISHYLSIHISLSIYLDNHSGQLTCDDSIYQTRTYISIYLTAPPIYLTIYLFISHHPSISRLGVAIRIRIRNPNPTPFLDKNHNPHPNPNPQFKFGLLIF